MSISKQFVIGALIGFLLGVSVFFGFTAFQNSISQTKVRVVYGQVTHVTLLNNTYGFEMNASFSRKGTGPRRWLLRVHSGSQYADFLQEQQGAIYAVFGIEIKIVDVAQDYLTLFVKSL